MRYFIFCLSLIVLHAIFPAAAIEGWHPPAETSVVYGEILEVDMVQRKLRIRTAHGMDILKLSAEAIIMREGSSVSLYAVRPVSRGNYQEGIFYLNARGEVELMYAHYAVYEGLWEEQLALLRVGLFGQVTLVEQL